MHRAGQRCFELLAFIGSPQLLEVVIGGRRYDVFCRHY